MTRKLKTYIKAVVFVSLAGMILFFGSALLSAILEVASTLSEASAQPQTTAGLRDTHTVPTAVSTDASTLRLDIQVIEDGTLSITETLSMPKLEAKLPAGGGYSRTLFKPERLDFNDDINTPPVRGFELDVVGASCDGESAPFHVHEDGEIVQFCVDPPRDSDPTEPHVYSITYNAKTGLYFPFWRPSERLVFTALYNEYEIPIDSVHVNITFPEDIVIREGYVDAWTGRGYQDRWIDLEDWRDNTNEYEVLLEEPNIVSLHSTGMLYDSETFVFRVFFPRGSVRAPFNRALFVASVVAWILAAVFAWILISFLYFLFFRGATVNEETLQPPETSTAAIEESDSEEVVGVAEQIVETSRPTSRLRAVLGGSFSIYLILLGLTVIYQLTVYPLMTRHDAMSWTETTCTIIELGHTFKYDYEWEGETYSSSQYDQGPFGWGFEQNFQRIKKDSPLGTQTICYVDPDDPTQAVLSHRLEWGYFFGLCSGAFMVLIGFTVRSITRTNRQIR